MAQPDRPGPDRRFSIQLYSAPEAQVAEAAEAGIGRVRIPLSWAAIEPVNTSPAEFRWSTVYEEGLAQISLNNMDVILTIEGNPSWAATYPTGPIDKVPIGEFVEFVVAAVQRYSSPPYDVKLWEFYNEPDNGDLLWAVNSGLGYWGNDPEAYADMLAAVYQPIKQVDPEAQVLIGGLCFDFWEEEGGPFIKDFLDRVLEHGGGDYFDVLNFHYYPTAFASKWDPYGPGLIGKTRFLRYKLAAFDLHKPMICTEAGVENVNTGTDEIQSRYVPMLYAQATAADLVSLSWFLLVDQDPGHWKTGLLYSDLTRKPAFYAYQVATERLGNSSFLRALSSEEKGTEAMEAYRFLGGDGGTEFIVAWTNDELTYLLSLATHHVFVVDKYGTASWAYDWSDGQVDNVTTVAVGFSPVYLYPEPGRTATTPPGEP
ncbi:MAG: cellulase family glycosylhydrolase [Anaerolineae bacterium]|nr:cellulase family glycosylhydrolase [Anaerolineae bacterium]